jgi:hypothetical protein
MAELSPDRRGLVAFVVHNLGAKESSGFCEVLMAAAHGKIQAYQWLGDAHATGHPDGAVFAWLGLRL